MKQSRVALSAARSALIFSGADPGGAASPFHGRPTGLTKHFLVGFAVLALSAALAKAGTINFGDPSELGTVYVLNGTAQITTDPALEISGQPSGELTDLSVSNTLGVGAAGSIVFTNPVSPSFNVSFTFDLFGGGAIPADGITLAFFGGNSPDVVGLCCSGLGFAEIVGPDVPAFSVGFDVYPNQDIDTCYDSSGNVAPCPFEGPAPYVAVNLGSLGVFSSTRSQDQVNEPDLVGEPHTTDISLSNNLLNVTLDGNPVITNFYVPPQDIPQIGYVGITGSTGSYAEYQIVNDISLTSTPEPATGAEMLTGIALLALFAIKNRRTGEKCRLSGGRL
jgi:hypothetical protein